MAVRERGGAAGRTSLYNYPDAALWGVSGCSRMPDGCGDYLPENLPNKKKGERPPLRQDNRCPPMKAS
ncbi:MAG: hypothetical protein ABSA46_19725 [Thermodesulfovibrionales bacterium]